MAETPNQFGCSWFAEWLRRWAVLCAALACLSHRCRGLQVAKRLLCRPPSGMLSAPTPCALSYAWALERLRQEFCTSAGGVGGIPAAHFAGSLRFCATGWSHAARASGDRGGCSGGIVTLLFITHFLWQPHRLMCCCMSACAAHGACSWACMSGWDSCSFTATWVLRGTQSSS